MSLKGLCQLESMRSEVMQITSNCQNYIVFTRDFLHVLCHVQGSELERLIQARSKHKMTGGAERMAHINSTPPPPLHA